MTEAQREANAWKRSVEADQRTATNDKRVPEGKKEMNGPYGELDREERTLSLAEAVREIREQRDTLNTIGAWSAIRYGSQETLKETRVWVAALDRALAILACVEPAVPVEGFIGWIGSGCNCTGWPENLSELAAALREYAALIAEAPDGQ